MSVNWYWKQKVGEIHYYDTEHKKHWKLELFSGNMMFAMIYRYTKVNEQTGKREKWHNFFLWFDDIDHLKRVLKDDKDFFKTLPSGQHILRKFRLCIYRKYYTWLNKDMLKVADVLVKHGYKVELY